ncbi:MAG TPA: NUDIX domain-containing protein [Burkholderiales bacterium]|nr:NUDIX domain-containing protein [Burkholderiales bacterium]
MHTPLLSAGVVVVRYFDDKPKFLLLRAYDYWDFPKGMVDAGEEPLAAAIREVEEETGLTGLNFRWGHGFKETEPYGNKNKIARYYIAESKEGEAHLPVSAELGKPEHDEFRWMSYDEAKELLVPRVRVILDWTRFILSNQN